jgi:membrane fusion protein, copper/silver efflux system
MNRERMRKTALIGLLFIAVFAVVWFSVSRGQPLHLTKANVPSTPTTAEKMPAKEMAGMEMAPVTSAATPPGAAPQDGTIFIAPEKQQLIGMRSVAAEMGTLTKDIRIVGKVSYDETKLTHIHSKVSGYIEEVFADSVGKPVHAGDPLFTIYSPDLVATEQDFLLALKSRSLLRDSTLASAAQGSENLIAAARERLRLWDVTDEDIRSLESEEKVKHATTVYSPITGVVMERAAYHHGTFVDPTKDLFTIVDLSRVWILGEVYETDIPLIRTGQTGVVELPYSGGGRRISGRVEFIYPFLDPKTRTVQVRMEFANPDLSLKPEMFTNITMSVSMGRQVLVPQDAVMDTGTEQYVFIDKGNGYVQPRQVKVSAETGEKVGIQQGLKPGERVVTAANFIVDSESRLKGAFAGMGAPSQPPAGVPGTTQSISVEVLEPKTAKTGTNTIRLFVKDASGKPITGAQVDVGLFMPQMGAMAPMSSKATLTESGNGVYAGQIEFLMAWTWQTTVTVRKNGAVVGVAETSLTAR